MTTVIRLWIRFIIFKIIIHCRHLEILPFSKISSTNFHFHSFKGFITVNGQQILICEDTKLVDHNIWNKKYHLLLLRSIPYLKRYWFYLMSFISRLSSQRSFSLNFNQFPNSPQHNVKSSMLIYSTFFQVPPI